MLHLGQQRAGLEMSKVAEVDAVVELRDVADVDQREDVGALIRHAIVVHGRDQRAHAASSFPPSNAAIANAKATDMPTYPM